MAENTHSRVHLDIDLRVLQANYRRIADAVAPCSIIAVMKANAYGLGVQPIAEALTETGAVMFAAAELNEALALTEFKLPVMILGGILPEEIPEAAAAGIVLPITDLETAGLISKEATSLGRPVDCHCLVDTGMGRLGILAADAGGVISECSRMKGLNLAGIYSHFPMAYRSGSDYTEKQIKDFLSLLTELEDQGLTFPMRHIANSDAVNNFPETYKPPFNAVRTGINLHGSFDTEGRHALDLKSILTLRTKLVAVRRLAKGTHIGYGCTYKLEKDMLIGTVSAGYADGLPLALSNRGHLLIRGQRCPVLGRVSMDYTTVSLEQVPEAACGDEVICLGGDGPGSPSVEDWAELKNTHPYDIICSFGSRVERCYVS